MSFLKVFLRLFLLFVFMVSLCSSLAMNPAGAATAKPKINWTPCYQEFGFPFECGTVHVPLDYDNPGLATVAIALVRLPATDPSRRIGSLFFNPGGPGGSGVDFVLQLGPFIYSDEVRARFDIVGFDPRGISRSTALRCFGNSKQWTPYFTPFAFPMTPEEAAIWEAADLYVVDACDPRGTRIIDHMSTADVARALDLLREAVGDDKLNYVGYSYGSYLGVTYANLFPDRFRALVVDGVLDPIEWSTGMAGEEALPFSTRLHSDIGAMDTLNEFFRLCDAGGAANCPFAPDAAGRFAALADRLKAEPLIITTSTGLTFEFTYASLISNALGAMYSSFSWPSFAEFLAGIEALAAPAVLGARLEAFWQTIGFINKRGFPHYPNYIEGFPGVACSDSDNPDTYPAWWAAAVASDANGYFGRLWTYASSLCATWTGSQQDRYAGPFDAQTTRPVLIVNTFFDPATRYDGALAVNSLLSNSRLLSVNGWGHTTPFLSWETDQAVSLYLLDGTLPVPNTIYNQDYVPFQTSSSAVAASLASTMRALMAPPLVPEAVRKGVRTEEK
jgi:pimeloyl-ACP methyl ester carboxylesterase